MPSPHRVLTRLVRFLTAPLAHRMRFTAIVALVVYADLVTKRLAIAAWSVESYPLVGRLVEIGVVYNRLGAFSTSFGRHTWAINVAGTVLAVLLAMATCSRLAHLDEVAPVTMGLIAGAGLGNLTSLMSSRDGVPDFLAISGEGGRMIVMNLADVAAMLGILCSLRLVLVLARTIAAAHSHRHA
jgi:lipoprotein signal peptidase